MNMIKIIAIGFAVIIVLTLFSGDALALNLMKKLPEDNSEKMGLTPLTNVGLNLPLTIVYKKKPNSLMETRYSTLADVNENRMEENDQATLSHFYQQIGDSSGTAWNVSTIDILMFAKYISLGLSIDRGDLSGPSSKLWTKNIVHRFGLEIGQSYRNNDTTFFGVKFAKEKYFPSFSFKLGYGWLVTQGTKACFEIQGITFGAQKVYTATSVALTRKYRYHELTVKPYWSTSKYSKFNLVLAEKFYIQQQLGYLSFQGVTGYFPDNDVFIDYNSITKQRFRFSGEGLFKVRGIQAMFHPVCGIDYSKGGDGSFRSNWFIKLGVTVPL
jgi:hypothetical protein